MFNLKEHNTIYKSYINYIIYKIYILFFDIINYSYKITKKNKIRIKNIKIYFDLLSIKSVETLNYSSYYTLNNSNKYYSFTLPIKFIFSSSYKAVNINYNILNIPKLTNTGDILINGFNRSPILYLKTIVKQVYFIFNNKKYEKYLIYLNNFNYLYVGIRDSNCLDIYLNDEHLIDNYFYLNFNNYSIKKVLNTLNCINNKENNIYNDILYNTYMSVLIYNYIYLDILNILNKFINVAYNKQYFINNDNLINKGVYNICTNLFDIVKESLNIYKFYRYFKYLYDSVNGHTNCDIELFRENFLLNPSLHYTTQLNLLAYLHNKFKINIFGYSSTSGSTFAIPKNLRNVQYTYLNFINMIYTIDGEKCGILSTVAPNLVVENKELTTLFINKKKFNNYIYLNMCSKSTHKIITNSNTITKKSFNFKLNMIEVLENGEFKTIKLKKTNINLNVNFLTIFNITELVIPFLLNNDICRSLMGSKMHTQAIPILHPDSQNVYTKYTKINNLISNKCVISYSCGVVIYSTNYKITIVDNFNRYINYYMFPYNITDYNGYTRYKPIVWKGERISIGSILAVPCDINNLEFTLGFNNIVNYSFYYGYEHEDAIVLNKKLVYKNLLASLELNITDINLAHIYDNHIELLVYKQTKTNTYLYKMIYTVFKKLKKQKQFAESVLFNNRLIKYPTKLTFTLDYIDFTQSDQRLLKYDCYFFNDENNKSDKLIYGNLKLFLANIHNIYIGDKLCGRHGNKGTISKIIDNIDSPYTSYDTCPNIITSPIGAASRMNVGQFLEGAVGNKCLYSNIRAKSPISLLNTGLYSNLYIKLMCNNFNNKYLYNKINQNSSAIFRDFKTGYKLKNFTHYVTLYYLKLVHTSKSKFKYKYPSNINIVQFDDEVDDRSQKFGEMEVWSLEAHGSSYNTKELSLIKTDINFLKQNQSKLNLCSKSMKHLLIELKSILINIKYNIYFKV
nr:RpoB2 [Babesia sp. Xinjiang]QAX26989.1 RpoB2 [Babesia sp. Xinjiang]